MTDRMPPDGQFRIVGADELFFSTTDQKGIIEQANSVFARLSQFSRPELMGAPHNLIRHPEMPGGAFHVMWNLLLSGRPMAAYVKNLAKDGKTYWVFATITPVGDKFLSVRTAPCARPLWETVNSVYNEVRPMELEAQEQGQNRHEAAELGAAAIAERINGLGFASYDDFIRYALPLEVASRLELVSQVPEPANVTGGLGELLHAIAQINAEVAGLLLRLTNFQDLADALAKASSDALATIASLSQATEMASQASASVVDSAPVLSRAANGMTVRSAEVSTTIESMAAELDRVRAWILELRFRIGLTQLHNDMAKSFVHEVADGRAPEEGLSYIPILCQALYDDVVAVSTDMSKAAQTLQDTSRYVDDAGEQLRDFQRGMATWRLLVPRYQMSRQLDPYVAPIDQQLNEGHAQMAALRSLAARCVAEALPFDPVPMQQAIERVNVVSTKLIAESVVH